MTVKQSVPAGKTVVGIIFLCVIFNLSGCASLKQTRKEGMLEISELQAFDGIYNNVASQQEDAEFSSLWNQLILQDKIDLLDFKNAKIRLSTLGKNQIEATWLLGDTVRKSIVLEGKLKDNYFVSRHKRIIIPIPLIYGQIKNNQFQLWIGQDNQLHLDRLQNRWGWVFVFLAGTDNTSSHRYEKAK
ncbi:hypothetical protein [Sphingobacterium sp. HMA12]|uniref:hypothetical protein n=1 Tax=Sphingobacterium sp. HMA12 TaxID=2050894 RepID=UPI0013159419|nr:hypothetical protein [Sphingobacterium sp. HMA12]